MIHTDSKHIVTENQLEQACTHKGIKNKIIFFKR